MRETDQKGFSLIQLLIVVMMISVLSTAFWNLHVNRLEASYDGYRGGMTENSLKIALEDIKYHLGLAGYGLENGKKPLKIFRGKESDRLMIWHNNICFEFFVDDDKNLVKKIENTDKIMAENVNSLKAIDMGDNRITITLSTVSLKENDRDKIETLSKSYSTVAEMKGLL